ncbi:MAG: hypothetical protein MUC44_06310 [Beijerinckiaceae bacterium]|jgi:hypothetical protein|nr:hypothetical protein [Beijerinckiaceae bacterium]
MSADARFGLRRAGCLAAMLTLAGCAADTGDLGRARPSLWNDNIYPTAGLLAGMARGEQVSLFHLTDDEMELRDRAWRYLMPAHERIWFNRQVQELARTRIIPVSWQTTEPDEYGAALTGGWFRSEHSLYTRLAEDALADAALIAPFRKMALRVAAADKVRIEVARRSPAVSPAAIEQAEARIAENEGLVAWVRERIRYRIRSYRHAFDNLVVELPSREAVLGERAMAQLEADARAFDALVKQRYRLGPVPVLKD